MQLPLFPALFFPMSDSSPLVHFDGSWPPGERKLIETAAEAAEAMGLPDPPSALAAPWVATRQALEDTCLYMASRQQGNSALMDKSVEGLAARIRRYAEQQVRPAGGPESTPHSETLFQLMYRSTETRAMTEADLRALLKNAREKNDRLGVTGLLLYAQGRFLQVLEGPESAVRQLYDTIEADPRHAGTEVLLTNRTAERVFPDWKMGLERPGAFASLEGLSSFLQSGNLPPAAEPMAEVLETLEQFRHSTSQE